MKAVIRKVTYDQTGIRDVEKYVGRIIDVERAPCDYVGFLPEPAWNLRAGWAWNENWLDFSIEGYIEATKDEFNKEMLDKAIKALVKGWEDA